MEPLAAPAEPLVVPAVLVELDSDFFSEVDPVDESPEEPDSPGDFAPFVPVVDFPSVRLSVR